MASPTIEEINATLNRTAQRLDRVAQQHEEFRSDMNALGDKIDRLGGRMGGFMNNSGEVCEEYFYRGMLKAMQVGDIALDKLVKNVRSDDRMAEIDLIGINGDSVVFIEVKQKAHPDEVEALTDRKVAAARRMYPDHEIYFGIASMVSSAALEDKARETGIFLLTQGGDDMQVVNDRVQPF